MILGAHESTAGKIHLAIDRAKEDGCNCVQVFAKSPRMWNSPPISNDNAIEFKKKAKEMNIRPNVSHASYLLNIANEDLKKRKFAVFNLVDEIKRAEQLGLMGVVLHPGSNANKADGLKFIIDGINEAIEKTKDCKAMILAENTAGSGNWIGSDFSELKIILDGIIDKSRFGFCFDTCHAFNKGYDIRDDYEKVFNEFDKIAGLNNIKCFHLNDAMFGLGSKKDRHENIGKGKIGKKGFRQLINDKRFEKIPGYLETPGPSYKENIDYLRELKINA